MGKINGKKKEVESIIQKGSVHMMIEVRIATADILFSEGRKSDARKIYLDIISMSPDILEKDFNERKLPYRLAEKMNSEKDTTYKKYLEEAGFYYRTAPLLETIEKLISYTDSSTQGVVRKNINGNSYILGVIERYKKRDIKFENERKKRSERINRLEKFLNH